MPPPSKIILVTLFVLTGCATTQQTIKQNEALSLTATQRVVVANKDGLICAEPSPDAIASLVTTLKASIKDAKGNEAGIDASAAKTMASMGIRTASVQILRDLAYRACEGHMNNVIQDDEYKVIVRNSGPVAVALMAVDGLTQMSPAPLVAVNTSVSAPASGVPPTSTSVTFNNTGKDYKPEELKNVADDVLKIVQEVMKLGTINPKP